MNTNFFHNILNFLFLFAGVLLAADLTVFGFNTETIAQISAGLLILQNTIKIVINISRDGVTGLVKEQPPVKD